MKKTIAVMFLMGSVAAVNAQDTLNSDLNNDPQRLEMTSSYHAKTTTNVPSHFRSNFQMAYPDATDVTWYEVHDNWYRAVHNQQGRTMHVYYTPNGSSFVVALPVIQSWVPEEVISTAISKYGHNIYSVNKVKVAGGTDAYQIGIIENGTLRSEWIGADGMAITDVFRSSMDNIAKETMLDTGNYAGKETEDTKVKSKVEMEDGTEVKKKTKVEMENGTEVKKKTKVEKADGTEIKTKTKKGKTKVKVDD